jgi:hypothetical protein
MARNRVRVGLSDRNTRRHRPQEGRTESLWPHTRTGTNKKDRTVQYRTVQYLPIVIRFEGRRRRPPECHACDRCEPIDSLANLPLVTHSNTQTSLTRLTGGGRDTGQYSHPASKPTRFTFSPHHTRPGLVLTSRTTPYSHSNILSPHLPLPYMYIHTWQVRFLPLPSPTGWARFSQLVHHPSLCRRRFLRAASCLWLCLLVNRVHLLRLLDYDSATAVWSSAAPHGYLTYVVATTLPRILGCGLPNSPP